MTRIAKLVIAATFGALALFGFPALAFADATTAAHPAAIQVCGPASTTQTGPVAGHTTDKGAPIVAPVKGAPVKGAPVKGAPVGKNAGPVVSAPSTGTACKPATPPVGKK